MLIFTIAFCVSTSASAASLSLSLFLHCRSIYTNTCIDNLYSIFLWAGFFDLLQQKQINYFATVQFNRKIIMHFHQYHQQLFTALDVLVYLKMNGSSAAFVFLKNIYIFSMCLPLWDIFHFCMEVDKSFALLFDVNMKSSRRHALQTLTKIILTYCFANTHRSTPTIGIFFAKSAMLCLSFLHVFIIIFSLLHVFSPYSIVIIHLRSYTIQLHFPR